jgi:hypothetical protein
MTWFARSKNAVTSQRRARLPLSRAPRERLNSLQRRTLNALALPAPKRTAASNLAPSLMPKAVRRAAPLASCLTRADIAPMAFANPRTLQLAASNERARTLGKHAPTCLLDAYSSTTLRAKSAREQLARTRNAASQHGDLGEHLEHVWSLIQADAEMASELPHGHALEAPRLETAKAQRPECKIATFLATLKKTFASPGETLTSTPSTRPPLAKSPLTAEHAVTATAHNGSFTLTERRMESELKSTFGTPSRRGHRSKTSASRSTAKSSSFTQTILPGEHASEVRLDVNSKPSVDTFGPPGTPPLPSLNSLSSKSCGME